MNIKNLILCTILFVLCGCAGSAARKNQSIAAANIYAAAVAIEQGVNPLKIAPAIKSQAILIIETNGDTLKGVKHGD